ncbi:hypothetical protein O4H52_14335 [Sphingomonadaceae bacterium G21617-S1]|nr:hypothetical protein [Sphingomonadaceae bacterium G21617-S1]
MRKTVASLAIGAMALLGLTAANAPDPETLSPRMNYILHCQGCHLADGSGMKGKVPDMRGQLGLLVQLPEGRAFVGRVPGVANAHLTDAQMARLLNWLVPEMGPVGHRGFVPYSAEEVGKLRRNRLQEVREVRARLAAQAAALRSR